MPEPDPSATTISRRAFLGAGAAGFAPAIRVSRRPYNVVFLPIDDLRCELGCYGRPWVHTPNIDRLASQGTVFTNAHCQIALCSPSRTSVMTGWRPDTTGIFDLRTHFRKRLPGVVTLPQQFHRSGYATTGFSKIYHLGNHTPGGLDDPDSWSEASWHPGGPKWGTRECRTQAESHREELKARQWVCDIALAGSGGKRWEVPAVEAIEAPDDFFTDGLTTTAAVEALEQLRGMQPFFAAIGYLNPHLPFVAPRRCFDRYPAAQVRLARNPGAPKDAPAFALHEWGELRSYRGMPASGPVTESQARDLVRGYWAATTFMDEQVGRVMAALARLGLDRNTIMVFWGDNGFHLGDHGLWSKHTNFEESTHVPLIIRAPGQASGRRVDTPVELLDIFPTLCELCGVPKPEGLEGASCVPLMEGRGAGERYAFSQFGRQAPGKGSAMGYSLRSERYRYTEWMVGREAVAAELYDYEKDPLESANLARAPQYGPVASRLSNALNRVRKVS